MRLRNDISEIDAHKKVLLIGDDMRSFLACARSLGRNGIEVHAAPFDWSSSALSSKYVTKSHRLPRLATNVAGWVNAIRELQAEHKFDLIIPCDERALIPLSAVPFSERSFKLADPGEKAQEFLFDKAKTRELASSLQIPIAHGELVDKFTNASLLTAQYGLPIMFKARLSFSESDLDARGEVFAVHSTKELDTKLRALVDGQKFLVESFFPKSGRAVGVGISVAARAGEILAAFQHRRITEKPGGGSSSVRISEDLDQSMLQAVEKMCDATLLNGVAMFEFRQCVETDEWILLEVNARPWGSMPLPLALGIDFPQMLFDVHTDNVGAYKKSYKSGIVGKNLALTLLYKLQGQKHGAGTLIWGGISETAGHIFNCIRGKEVSDSFVWDDLRPAIFEFSALLKRGINRVLWQRSGSPERRRAQPRAVEEPLVLRDEVPDEHKKTL